VTHNPGDESPRELAAIHACRLANARWTSVIGRRMRYTTVRGLDDFLIEDVVTGGWIYVEDLLSDLGYHEEAKAYPRTRIW